MNTASTAPNTVVLIHGIWMTPHKEFPGRSHFPGQDGWEELADYALDWTVSHATLA